MSGRFDHRDRHDQDLIEAINAGAHRIATAIEKGFALMADAQAQALADLNAAVTANATAISAAAAQIVALLAAAQNIQPDDSAAIEAQVTAINTATAALTAASAPAPAAKTGP